jgi:hypothetical protein
MLSNFFFNFISLNHGPYSGTKNLFLHIKYFFNSIYLGKDEEEEEKESN